MKKITALTSLLAAGLILFASCDRERIDYGLVDDNTATTGGDEADGPFGILAKPGLSYDSDVATYAATRSAGLDDYLIGLYKEDGTQIDLIRYGDIGDDGRVLRVGRYRLTASSHTPQAAEWNNPWYYGETPFDIEENKINDKVAVRCTQNNLAVAVDFEPDLLAILDNDYTVQVEIGEGQLTYTRTQYDQNTLGYFYAPGEGDIFWAAFFNGTVDGQPTRQQISGSFSRETQRLVITFKLKSTDMELTRGGATPSVRLDASVTRIERNENIIIEEEIIEEEKPEPGPGEEEPQPQGVTVFGKNFNGAPFDIKGAVTLLGDIPDEGVPVVVGINAPAGVQVLYVDIVSETLSPNVLKGVGFTDHIDLVHPGEFKEQIMGFEFPVEDEVVGQTALDFDITRFTPMLGIYPGTHRFVLHVEDSTGNGVTETLTIIVQK